MIKLFEILAFTVSAAAFCFGVVSLFRIGTAKQYPYYVYAAGCYMLEELWVVVNSLLGNGNQDGLLTVRLFGFFGCLCFLLSAKMIECSYAEREWKDRRLSVISHVAPVVMIAIYAVFLFNPDNTLSSVENVIGFVSLTPAFFASYFSMKHLMLKSGITVDSKYTKLIDVVTLVFYAANSVYPLVNLYLSDFFMGICDVILAVMLFVIIVLCRKGALKWKTRT